MRVDWGAGNKPWDRFAREIFTGVMYSFIRLAPGKWELRDILLALRSKERLREILRKSR